MKTVPCLLVVLVLAGALVLSGCKLQPDKPKPEAKPPEPGASEVPVAPAIWQWPLSSARLAQLLAMPVQKRNETMRSMLPPVYDVRRTTGSITLDGVLAEDDWVLAPTIKFRDVQHGTPAWYPTTVRVLYGDDNLYVSFQCDGPNVVAGLPRRDDPLWKDDSVEVMIDANGDEKAYVELMVSAANVLYDAVWGDFRRDADWMTQPTWERFEMDSVMKAYAAEALTSVVKVNGTLNALDDKDKGYTVEMAIPWTALRDVEPFRQARGKIDMTLATLLPVKPPKAGTIWRMNFVRNNPSAPMLSEGEVSAWSPTGGSVHLPSAFGRVRFVNGN